MGKRCLVVFSILTLLFAQDALSQGMQLVGADGVPVKESVRKLKDDVRKRKKASEDEAGAQTIFMYGMSFSFSDSIMYVTDIQQMDSVTIKDKYLLAGRDQYSLQFKKWLEAGGAPTQVSAINFFSKRGKAAKKFEKMRKGALKKHHCTIISVPEFKFSAI